MLLCLIWWFVYPLKHILRIHTTLWAHVLFWHHYWAVCIKVILYLSVSFVNVHLVQVSVCQRLLLLVMKLAYLLTDHTLLLKLLLVILWLVSLGLLLDGRLTLHELLQLLILVEGLRHLDLLKIFLIVILEIDSLWIMKLRIYCITKSFQLFLLWTFKLVLQFIIKKF